MTLRTMWVAAALALLGPTSLTGCQGDPETGTSTLAPTTEISPTTEPADTTDTPPDDDVESTTAPPELSAEEQDEVGIEKTLHAYSAALDRARIGEDSIEGIYPISRDTAREQWLTQMLAYEAQGITFSGVSELEVLEISVVGDRADAMACVDVSGVDAAGRSRVALGSASTSLTGSSPTVRT